MSREARLFDTSGGATNNFYYVTSGAGGSFSITGDYSCTANTQVYLYSLGGNPGLSPPSTDNAAAGLHRCAGQLPRRYQRIRSPQLPLLRSTKFRQWPRPSRLPALPRTLCMSPAPVRCSPKPALQNAFANAVNLANLASGTALAIPPVTPPAPRPRPRFIRSPISSPVASTPTAPSAVGASPTPCYTLLTNALSVGTTGAQPTDTATAAINIAHNPGANVDALWVLIPRNSAFGSGLTTEPNDFTLGIQFTSGGLNSPNAIAIDGFGNVWITNSGSTTNTVTELSSLGAATSGSPYSAGGMNGLVGIAIDLSTPGNAWIANDSHCHDRERDRTIQYRNTGFSLALYCW